MVDIVLNFKEVNVDNYDFIIQYIQILLHNYDLYKHKYKKKTAIFKACKDIYNNVNYDLNIVATPLATSEIKNAMCSICLETTNNNFCKTGCNHVFHKHCIDKWCDIGVPECPLCKTAL